MVIKFCPNCNQRYVIDSFTTDYVHECNSGNPALDQEDVVVVGNWEDYSGSGTVPPQQVLRQGSHNELQGRRPDIEGEDNEDETPRGNRKSTHRQRQHFQYINLKNDGLQ